MKQRADILYMLFLAVTAAVGGLLFGYDTAVISGTVELVTARFGLDSLQQGWYVGCALAGSVAGVLCAGVLSDRLGRRRTMLVSAVLFTVSAVGCALCADFTQLVVYRIVGGLGIGVVSIVSPLYISEVSAARRRHLGDVKRRDDRNDADAQPAHDPVDDQLREIGAKGASHGRHREQHGRNEHRPPASQPVAQHARTEYAGDRAGQRTPHIPPLLQAVQPEAGRHQLDGARNHGRVVSEQESAHGSRDRKKEHVQYVSALFHGAFTVSGKGCRF